MAVPNQIERSEDDYKEYLDSIDYDELVRKIEEFEGLTYSDYTDDQIVELFRKTLISDGKVITNISERTMPAHSWHFFRIRRIRESVTPVESWFREPPFNPKRPNRFDFLDRSIMYVSFTNGAAVVETKIKDTETYAEAVFTNNRDVRLIAIGMINDTYWKDEAPVRLSKEQLKKAKAIDDFEFNLMTMKDDDGVSAHRVAQIVAKCIYGNADRYDGILYPSVACKAPYEYNVAFFNGKESLDLEYALIHRNLYSKDVIGMWFKDGVGQYQPEDQAEVVSRKKKVDEFFAEAFLVDADMLKKLS